jgi:uncharacterized membrane protein
VLVRDLAVVGLCALVIRQIYRPERDLVRAGGRVDDPAGGVFDGAPDEPPSWLPARLRPPPPHETAVQPGPADFTSQPSLR